jgi:hypothetical protein
MSVTIKPMQFAFPGDQASCGMVRSIVVFSGNFNTRCLVSSLTLGLLFKASDAVPIETFAILAMSLMVSFIPNSPRLLRRSFETF